MCDPVYCFSTERNTDITCSPACDNSLCGVRDTYIIFLRGTKCPPKMGPCHRKADQKSAVSHDVKNRLKNMKPIPRNKKCPKKTVVVQAHEQLCTTVIPRACKYALQCVSFELLHVVCSSNSKEIQGSPQCRQEVSCIETLVARLATSNCLLTRHLIVCVCEN